MDPENQLIVEMATLSERVGNLTKIIEAFIDRVKAQDKRITALETSRTQAVTTIAIVFTAMGGLTWASNSYVNSLIDEKIQDADLTYILCSQWRISHSSGKETPPLCQ